MHKWKLCQRLSYYALLFNINTQAFIHTNYRRQEDSFGHKSKYFDF